MGKLKKLVEDQQTYVEEKFKDLMQNITNLSIRIEHVAQRHHRAGDNEEEDTDVDAEARRADRGATNRDRNQHKLSRYGW